MRASRRTRIEYVKHAILFYQVEGTLMTGTDTPAGQYGIIKILYVTR